MLQKLDYVSLDGIMGYEAQIAGVADYVPGKFMMNGMVRLVPASMNY